MSGHQLLDQWAMGSAPPHMHMHRQSHPSLVTKSASSVKIALCNSPTLDEERSIVAVQSI